MISATFPEPRCDIAAQLRALIDPAHPKDAVWVGWGTAIPVDIELPELVIHETPFGILLTTCPQYAQWLRLSPTDDTLAAVLGYIEPKSQLYGIPVVVQACDENGAVITEFACSEESVPQAIQSLSAHGEVRLTNVPEALRRRRELCQAEAR